MRSFREKAKVISMSIFEFDQELHDKTIRQESWEDGRIEGRVEGRIEGRVSQVCRKLRKGKNAETIADELEEDIAEVRQICEIAEAFAPEYDAQAVFHKLMEGQGRLSIG